VSQHARPIPQTTFNSQQAIAYIGFCDRINSAKISDLRLLQEVADLSDNVHIGFCDRTNNAKIKCGRIEGSAILPTNEQGFACICVCQMLSNGYRDVRLFRFDPIAGTIYVLAAESLEVLITRDGNWRFIDDETEF